MVWNTIAHPKMMHNDGLGGVKYADTHKMAFYDAIMDATQLDYPFLVKGDYESIYNKLINDEVVFVLIVRMIHGDDTTPFARYQEGYTIGHVGIDDPSWGLVDGRPIIYIGSEAYLDCHNSVYLDPEDIPFDEGTHTGP